MVVFFEILWINYLLIAFLKRIQTLLHEAVMTILSKARIQGHTTNSATRKRKVLMSSLGMRIGFTLTFAIHSLIHSNIELKTFRFLLPFIGQPDDNTGCLH